MKTWTERLPRIIAFIESGNGLAKKKAKEELEKMAIQADKLKILENEINSKFWKRKNTDKEIEELALNCDDVQDDSGMYGFIAGFKKALHL